MIDALRMRAFAARSAVKFDLLEGEEFIASALSAQLASCSGDYAVWETLGVGQGSAMQMIGRSNAGSFG